MKKSQLLFCIGFSVCSLVTVNVMAQTVTQRLAKAVAALEADTQMQHAIVGFYVVDTKSGNVVYAHNEEVGLAPGSTQKLFTSAAAFALLGKDFRYKTLIGYDGKSEAGTLNGNIHFIASGDPTLGSIRWGNTKAATVLGKITAAVKGSGIKRINGDLFFNDTAFELRSIPRGWIWEDIGNYYGAGSWGFNWNENQYDLILKPGKAEGDPTTILAAKPALAVDWSNQVTTGKKGSGDNSYIYLPPYGLMGSAEGTVPPGDSFTIKGSLPNPPVIFAREVASAFSGSAIEVKGTLQFSRELIAAHSSFPAMQSTLATLYSPSLDSINYWFLQKSINLYGEALVKAIALKQNGYASTEMGVRLVRDFWQEQGISKAAIHISDGSGLSPQNRVTVRSLVNVLQFATRQSWYKSFLEALPVFNAMKMKSGTIGGVKAFAGYHTGKTGGAYSFAIIINNYDGSLGELTRKMYKVLDVLK